MSESKRITPRMVRKAYRETGLTPCRGTARAYRGGICAIGALSQQLRGTTASVYDWAEKRFGENYADEFMAGFDWEPGVPKSRSQGFRDGLTCAAAVFGEAPNA